MATHNAEPRNVVFEPTYPFTEKLVYATTVNFTSSSASEHSLPPLPTDTLEGEVGLVGMTEALRDGGLRHSEKRKRKEDTNSVICKTRATTDQSAGNYC